MDSYNEKNIGLAVLLNFLIPGAGYLYMGRIIAGIASFIFVIPLSIFTFGIAWLIWVVIMIVDMLLIQSSDKRKYLKQLKKCMNCSELIKKDAKKCRYCHTEIDVSLEKAF